MPRENDEVFVNPYIFLPLEDRCQKVHSVKELKKSEDLKSGWIECKLLTKSAIFIPNTSYDQTFTFPDYIIDDNAKDYFKSYDFYSYQEIDENTINPKPPKPIIPGSELRAIIRIAYEILTNSCLQIVDNKITLHKRLPNSGDAARIYKESGKWYMKKCQKVRIKKHRVNGPYEREGEYYFQIDGTSEYQEGDRVYINMNRKNIVLEISNHKTNQYKEEGYIHFSADFGRKKYESVFIDNGSDPIQIDDEEVNNYIKNIDVYNTNDTYSWIKPKQNQYLVYYKKKNNRYYFKPGEIGRDVFYNSIVDLLKRNNYDPCVSIDELCSACILFGFTSDYEEKEKNALGSRIRITDAKPINTENYKELFFPSGILKELASPKTQATEFYLKRPVYENNKKVDLWTYDYAGNWINQELEWQGKESYKPEICGRKFYWHQEIVNEDDLPYINKDDDASRKIGIRPLKPNVAFTFKIFFNNVKLSELKKLLWALEIGHKNNSKYHKIGMGKPLGLGSVKIIAQKVLFREIQLDDNNLSYTLKSDEKIIEEIRDHTNSTDLLGCSEETLDKYLILTEFNNSLKNIEYPNNVDSEENYQWFMDNRIISPGSSFEWIINQNLCNNISNPKLKKYSKGKTKEPKAKKIKKRAKPKSGVKKKGTVKWFNSGKGYGFIDISGEDDDAFVHYSNIISDKKFKKLIDGEEVEFELIQGKKGSEAIKVKRIDK